MPPGNSKNLHSRYNPHGEAERYVNSLDLRGEIRFFILIEPGLGYMIPFVRKRNREAKIIALHCEEAAYPAEAGNRPDSSWHPGGGLGLQDFLENEIPDTEARSVKIIEWRPSLAVFGEAYLGLLEETAEFIKRSDANARTTGEFGRRWFKNFFKNLDILEELLCVDKKPSSPGVPMVITGAGPGLEDIIPFLKEEKRKAPLLILAVSSSAPALEAGGIVPDLVISTDGGGWALLHLYECWRLVFSRPGGGGCSGLATALTAALPSQCAGVPVLPISDGSLWQSLVLRELGIPCVSLPQRGTVSASALDLAFSLTEENIFVAGVDLALEDIRGHVRPYSFDRLWEEKESRLNPLYSQSFTRAAGIRAGGSHKIYASWFSRQIGVWPKRLFPLGKNNPLFQGLQRPLFGPTPSPPKKGRGETPGLFRTAALKKIRNPAGAAGALLRKAMTESRYGAALKAELGALLMPGQKASPKDLDEAVRFYTKLRGGHE
jgi:hypothetical protein